MAPLGYYNVISAGVQEPVRAQYFLVNASKAAKSAHVDQAKTVEGTTKMLTGFAGELENSAEALDLLFTIEREGQTTFAQLVPIIGNISAISREAKVSATEMGGALALLTQTSGSTSEAATKYKAILMGLYKPQEKMAKLISQIGYASGQAMVQELGLANTLQAVKEHTEQANIPLGKLFESSEALVGIAALSANNFETFRQKIDNVGNSAGALDKAFENWKQTFEATRTAFDNTIADFLVELGGVLVPEAKAALKSLTDLINENKEDVIEAAGKLVEYNNALAGIITLANLLPGNLAEYGATGYILFGKSGPLKILSILYLVDQAAGAFGNSIGDIAKKNQDVVTDVGRLWESITAIFSGDQNKIDAAILKTRRRFQELGYDIEGLQGPAIKSVDVLMGQLGFLEGELSRLESRAKLDLIKPDQGHINELKSKIAALREKIVDTDAASLAAAASTYKLNTSHVTAAQGANKQKVAVASLASELRNSLSGPLAEGADEALNAMISLYSKLEPSSDKWLKGQLANIAKEKAEWIAKTGDIVSAEQVAEARVRAIWAQHLAAKHSYIDQETRAMKDLALAKIQGEEAAAERAMQILDDRRAAELAAAKEMKDLWLAKAEGQVAAEERATEIMAQQDEERKQNSIAAMMEIESHGKQFFVAVVSNVNNFGDAWDALLDGMKAKALSIVADLIWVIGKKLVLGVMGEWGGLDIGALFGGGSGEVSKGVSGGLLGGLGKSILAIPTQLGSLAKAAGAKIMGLFGAGVSSASTTGLTAGTQLALIEGTFGPGGAAALGAEAGTAMGSGILSGLSTAVPVVAIAAIGAKVMSGFFQPGHMFGGPSMRERITDEMYDYYNQMQGVIEAGENNLAAALAEGNQEKAAAIRAHNDNLAAEMNAQLVGLADEIEAGIIGMQEQISDAMQEAGINRAFREMWGDKAFLEAKAAIKPTKLSQLIFEKYGEAIDGVEWAMLQSQIGTEFQHVLAGAPDDDLIRFAVEVIGMYQDNGVSQEQLLNFLKGAGASQEIINKIVGELQASEELTGTVNHGIGMAADATSAIIRGLPLEGGAYSTIHSGLPMSNEATSTIRGGIDANRESFNGFLMKADAGSFNNFRMTVYEKHATGGWLAANPGGGWIRRGLGGVDDVFLGVRGGMGHMAMRNEFVVKPAAAAKNAWALNQINYRNVDIVSEVASLLTQRGYASGGYVGGPKSPIYVPPPSTGQSNSGARVDNSGVEARLDRLSEQIERLLEKDIGVNTGELAYFVDRRADNVRRKAHRDGAGEERYVR